MEQYINLGLTAVLVLLEIILYFILLGSVLPKILRPFCNIRECGDRGLEKYVYPEGRGILYEPHPAFRKYVRQYALYTNLGYKYLKCKLDEEILHVKYTVVMFNKDNKILDVLNVNERNIPGTESKEIRLHHSTSYISLSVLEANGKPLESKTAVCCKLWRLITYSTLVAAACLFETLFIKEITVSFSLSLFGTLFPANATPMATILLMSLAIGLTVGFLTYIHHYVKGIKWTL